MTEISQLNLLMAAMGKQAGGQRKTPADVGESLFQDFLIGGGRQVSGENRGLAIADGKGTKDRVLRNGKDVSTPLETLDEKFRYVGGFLGHLRLPGTAAEQLARFLEKQGFNRKDIDRLILAATDQDGMIRLGRLMTRLHKEGAGEVQAGGNFVVKSGDVPEVESMLMEMGLDIGKVKNVIEKSVDAKGDLILRRMTEGLTQFMSGSISEEQLVSLLESQGIKSRIPGIQGVFQDPELKSILKGFSETSSQDIQQKVKQDIAQLLREKGVPPQEVKSFLENLSVKYSESLTKGDDQAASAARTALTEKDATNLLNQVVITTRKGWNRGGLNEKIMDILRKENLIGKNDLNKELSRDETSAFRLNTAELMKAGEKNGKISDLQMIMGQQGDGSRELRTGRGKATGQGAGDKQNMRSSLEMKDLSGNQIHSARGGKENFEVTSSSFTKNANALPQPLPKIVDRMIWMIRGGEQKGSLHISPPELGKLDLDLVIRQGHLQANLNAENPAVKEIIEANLNQLKQHLQEQGFVVEKFTVTVGQDQQRSPEDHQWAKAGRRRRGSGRDGIPPETAAVSSESAVRSAKNLSQIDVHV